MSQQSSRIDTPRAHRPWARAWPLIASLLALELFIAFEAVSISTVLPVVTADLDARAWYSLAFAGTLTASLVGMIAGGDWADRSGLPLPLTAGGVLFVAGIVLCVVAPAIGVFIAGRVVQGLGGGVVTVLLYVVIAKAVPDGARARVFGLLTAAWVLPSMVGPLVAGMLVETMHWRVVFAVVAAGAAAALVVLLWAVVRRRLPGGTGRGAVFGRRGWWAVAAAAALLALHLGGHQEDWLAVVVVPAGIVALVITAWRLLPRGTLRGAAGAPRLVAMRALLGAGVAAADVYVPLYLQAERGLRPSIAGLLVAVGAIGWATGAAVQGRAEGRADPATLIRVATGLALAGPVAALLVVVGVAPVWTIAIGSIVMGVGMGMAYPVVTSVTLSLAPVDEQGFYSSALQAGESIATSGMLALTGILLATVSAHPYAIVYALLVGITALAWLTGWFALGSRSARPR